MKLVVIIELMEIFSLVRNKQFYKSWLTFNAIMCIAKQDTDTQADRDLKWFTVIEQGIPLNSSKIPFSTTV